VNELITLRPIAHRALSRTRKQDVFRLARTQSNIGVDAHAGQTGKITFQKNLTSVHIQRPIGKSLSKKKGYLISNSATNCVEP
jgi:hypothetical protein